MNSTKAYLIVDGALGVKVMEKFTEKEDRAEWHVNSYDWAALREGTVRKNYLFTSLKVLATAWAERGGKIYKLKLQPNGALIAVEKETNNA